MAIWEPCDLRLCWLGSGPTTIAGMFFDDVLPLLPRDGCEALLASSHVGRMSLTIGALPAVLPVTYQYLGGAVIIGMRDGPALRRLGRENVVALEIDNANLIEATWAVLVIGHAVEVTDADERAEFQALDAALSPNGIVHLAYVRLHPHHVTGYRTVAP